MANNGNNKNAKHFPVFKLAGRRNKMEFIRSFPGIADHYGVRAIIYENVPRPEHGDDLAERQAQWDIPGSIGEIEILCFCTGG